MISERLNKINTFLAYLFFLSPLYAAINLFNLGTFNFSMQFLVSLLLLASSFALCIFENNLTPSRIVVFVLLLVVSILFAILGQNPVNGTGILLLVYWLLFYLFVIRTDNNRSKKSFSLITACKWFLSISSVLCLFGIYQFISYSFLPGAPLSEIIPEQILVSGYNTYQFANVGSFTLFKAHSIYLEASSFSQISAIGLILSISLKNSMTKHKLVLYVVLNSIGLLISLSGTGLLMIAVFGLYLFLLSKISVKKKIALAISLSVFIVIVLNTSIGKYLLSRVGEMSSDGYSSGYYRFLLPFDIFLKYFKTYPFGFGVGNDNIALKMVGAFETSIGNGYGKILVELGIAGLALMFLLLLSVYPRNMNVRTSVGVPIFIIIVMLNMVGTSYMQPSFWSFVSALSISGATIPCSKHVKYNAVSTLKKLQPTFKQ